MKKIILLFTLFCNCIYSQHKVKPISSFSSLRIGITAPFHFGNNSLNNDAKNNIGFNTSVSLVKVYDYTLSFGYEYLKYNINDNFLADFKYINKNTILFQLDYNIELNPKFNLSPNISYTFSNLNYIKDGSRKAAQNGNEIRFGSTIDYKLNNTFSTYVGLNYIYYHNNLNATEENKKYYGQSNSIQLSLGFKIN
jgi:hypothetical protein